MSKTAGVHELGAIVDEFGLAIATIGGLSDVTRPDLSALLLRRQSARSNHTSTERYITTDDLRAVRDLADVVLV